MPRSRSKPRTSPREREQTANKGTLFVNTWTKWHTNLQRQLQEVTLARQWRCRRRTENSRLAKRSCIEGNARGRRRLCERENCDSSEDRRNKGRHDREQPGARIDAAGGRLTRAQQRAKEASEALEMAPRVVEESDVEIACIECELHDLEAALAHVPAVSAAIGVDNTVDSVSGQLQRLQAILKENSRVDLQPDAPGYSSLCTAHRGVSTCLRGSGAGTWSQSGLTQRDCAGNKPRKSIHCEREGLLQQHQSEHDDRSDGQRADAAPETKQAKADRRLEEH